MTVSYSLRSDERISEEVRSRVARVARALGYRRDPVLAQLMAHLHRRRTGEAKSALALINVAGAGEFREPRFAPFLRAAEAQAAELGYGLDVFDLRSRGMNERRLAGVLRARGIRGVVISHGIEPGQTLGLDCTGLAGVEVGETVTSPALHRVAADHFANASTALATLRGLGYRRIGFACAPERTRFHGHRLLAAYLLHQATLPEDERVEPLWREGGERRAFAAWFRRHRPEAVVGLRGEPLGWLEEMGVKVPEEAAYADLIRPGNEAGPAGMDPDYVALGRLAVTTVAGLVERGAWGVPEQPTVTAVHGRWMEGWTVRVARNSGRAR